MSASLSTKRRWLVPEVIQTSAMDCGPAVLKCLLEGYGIPIHYGRLREACQTDVDGTSIDVLEHVASQLGLAAEQVMLPVDHLLLPEADALPAILVVTLANRFAHFVLLWRRHGPFVQVMDPSAGRRWLTTAQLLEEVYVHRHAVPAELWHSWARSEGLRLPLNRRLRNLGVSRTAGDELIETAAAAEDWRSLGRLDAATRFAAALVRAGGLRRGREVQGFLQAVAGSEPAGSSPEHNPGGSLLIPEAYWSAQAAPAAVDGSAQVQMRGAVLLRIRGRLPSPSAPSAALGPEMAAALAEPSSHPARTVLRLLRGTGVLSWVALAVGLVLSAAVGVLEALVFRGVLDLGRDLALIEQRLFALGCFLFLGGAVVLLELRVAGALLRLGRRLEVRLRQEFLEKLPRLNDRYFQSRPTSDMSERSHALQLLRLLPGLAGRLLRTTLMLLLTVAAIAWIDPAGSLLAGLAAAVVIGIPLLCLPLLQGLDLRVRTHAGALSRFYLDALLGLTAVRSHNATGAVRREHEDLLVEWVRAGQRLLRAVVAIEGVQLVTGFGLAGWLLLAHVNRGADAGALLLLAYWALNLPVLGEEIGLLVRQWPGQRNVTLRLLEPLGALAISREPPANASSGKDVLAGGPQVNAPGGVAVALDHVTVQATGHTILHDVTTHIEAGSHVAVVGASGAGKSTLLGLLLGWHRAAAGSLSIDGEPLDEERLERLRAVTAWVDPAVQLWNRSLADNLRYGTLDRNVNVGDALQPANLFEVLQRLPDGLQTLLGEGGGRLSGGEAQRVRLGRALLRKDARLALLDEPFRGLDRDQRRQLLHRAREHWRHATLLCVTHDVGETSDFPRVLVIDAGRVVEDGVPAMLAAADSHYRALLEAEEAVRKGLWTNKVWRRLRLEAGQLHEDIPEEHR